MFWQIAFSTSSSLAAETLNIEHVGAVYDCPNQVRNQNRIMPPNLRECNCRGSQVRLPKSSGSPKGSCESYESSPKIVQSYAI